MHSKCLTQAFLVLAIGIYTLSANAAPTAEPTTKQLNNMMRDPDGFIHVAEDGVARSYASNGTVIDYAPLSNAQLAKMVKNLPITSDDERNHVLEAYAKVDGFSVKDPEQIYHPSTQLQPAIDPATTHWQKDTDVDEPDDSNVTVEERYVKCVPTRCTTGQECTGMGCDVCVIAYDMSARFCSHGDY